MFTKKFIVVGFSVVNTANKSFKVVHCLGESFYDTHQGDFTCTCFVDINYPISVGDNVNVIRAGKNFYIIGKE